MKAGKKVEQHNRSNAHLIGVIDMLSMIGLIGGLGLLIYLTMRGMNLLVVGPLSALFVAVFSGMPLFPQLAGEGGNQSSR